MNDDVTGLAFICGTSTLINTVYSIQKGNGAITTLTAGALVFVCLAVFSGVTGRPDVAKAIAMLYFVGALILHGAPLVTGLNSVVSSTQTKTQK